MAHLGEQAVVIGAGMGGLSAAAALSPWFERVCVLDRDDLPVAPGARAGTPQCRHGHALLTGGLYALCELLPGFDQDLIAAGAVTCRAGLDVRFETPDFRPLPQRDLGWDFYAVSRPVNEFTLRRRVAELGNVTLLSGCRADELIARPDGARVAGLRYEDGEGQAHELAADLVVEASGSGALTMALLDAVGRASPPLTTIGVDLHYSTAVFVLPDDPDRKWKMLATGGRPPSDSRAALLLPMERGQSMVTLVGRGADRPPGDWDGYMAYAQSLASPTLHDALKNAEKVGQPLRYRFAASVRRHFERLGDFPEGLLPFSDAACRFNPAFGQGMSVAAQEARVLHGLLGERAASGQGLRGLAPAFFEAIQPVLQTPWSMIAGQDFLWPDTKGEPPPNLEASTQFGRGLLRLAAEDPEVHRLWQQVTHLLKPSSVYQDPALVQRVMAVMAMG